MLRSCNQLFRDCYNVEILTIFDPELQLINIKPITKKQIKRTAEGVEKV